MLRINPIFLIDFYKAGHIDQYPKDTTQVWSNWTPRATRVPGANHVVHFGLQYFIKEILQYEFQKNFFDRPIGEVILEYSTVMSATLGLKFPRVDHIASLHNLGYLPITIYSLPEGVNVPLRVPAMIITNTLPDFFWLPNYLESILSNIMWKPTTSATTAQRFREIFVKYAKQAGETDLSFVDWMGHDFSFRGMSGREDAILSGMGHLLSFSGTDTLPAILAARQYYGADLSVGGSVPATEHSVMCAGTQDGEFETFRHLLEDVYPTGIVSIVSDTWDLWKVLQEYIPKLSENIHKREGKIVIRPDSGDPVLILTGDPSKSWDTPESVGALELLARALGITTNAAGYAMIDHGGLIYGDGISTERAEEILKRAVKQGFSPYNLVFGIGSFTYEYQTRDSYGFAMKATAVIRDGKLLEIFKKPVTDDGLKTSLKGIPAVYGKSGHYQVVEGVTPHTLDSGSTAMRKVYSDGVLLIEETFSEIRSRVRESEVVQEPTFAGSLDV